ncbi:site-specific integrase [Enterococcus faecium]|uniref:site-specific integrase n=1 Tax=Enterococcus faecium TaxID=1352 RepID=UPI002004537C|nr:site-specific integrase [Enterococcus faecium]MCK6017220.1 site-specific integrase [Enterococcus faecium]MCK6055123.1 site-specific integrase [Enterococcus faecium]MCZ9357020.1 site-specific integrase [Enterococcus faecium]
MATFKQYETKKGKFWLYEAYLGINKMTGKPDKVRRRGFKTKKEAQLALSRLQVDYDKNGIRKANNETFKDVYDLWLETYKTTVREVTFIKTEIKFRKWILPKYGKLRMNEVTVKKAQQIVNIWAETTDQYKVLHSTSKRIFSYAINLGIIETNPLDNVLMPKRTTTKHKEKVKVYSKEQLITLFDYLNSKPETYRNDFDKTLLRFLFYSGVRISEALALNWSDIDFQENTVTINKTLSQSKNGYKISDPKTDRSAGVLPLDERTISILKKWQINQRKYMLTLGITDPTMIFCGIYKELITHHAIYARLITICEKAMVPFLGVHVTRHTHASMLLDAGATMVEVQTRLRHTKISQTIDCYGHLAKETKEKTVEKLVQHLNID